jgi:hypothetical protein
MEKEDLQKDMAIFISKTCKNTKRFFGWDDEMDKYKGTIQVIDSFNKRSNGHCCVRCYDTEGYNWSNKDFELLPKSPKPKSIRFDTKDLHL